MNSLSNSISLIPFFHHLIYLSPPLPPGNHRHYHYTETPRRTPPTSVDYDLDMDLDYDIMGHVTNGVGGAAAAMLSSHPGTGSGDASGNPSGHHSLPQAPPPPQQHSHYPKYSSRLEPEYFKLLISYLYMMLVSGRYGVNGFEWGLRNLWWAKGLVKSLGISAVLRG